MKTRTSVTESIRRITENVQTATWTNLESEISSDPSLSHWLKDLEGHSGRVPVRDSIIVREKEDAVETPNEEVADGSP